MPLPPEDASTRRPLTVGGVPLHESLGRRTRAIADELLDLIAVEIPPYRQLPDEAMRGEVRQMARHSLDLLSDMFRHRRPPSASDMEAPRASAGRRAQEGFPLEAVLTAYHLGARHVFDSLFTNMEPSDVDDLVEAHKLIMVYAQDVTAAVCAGYTAERESMVSEEHDARHAVVSALLNGERPVNAGALAGVRLASHYLVLTLTIGPHPDEDDAGPGAPYAGRRKLGRIRAVLDAFATEPVLSVLDVAGGLILVPIPDATMDWTNARHLVEVMAKAAGAPIRAAGEVTAIADVAPAARVTQEVLEVVRTFGHAPGLYRLTDVLLEYQLTQPSPAMRELAALLDPLDENPDLLRTIEAHLETGLDRRATAALLHVHPNTVDYRLRRAVHLTGLDPMNPPQLQRIGAALAARRKLID